MCTFSVDLFAETSESVKLDSSVTSVDYGIRFMIGKYDIPLYKQFVAIQYVPKTAVLPTTASLAA